MALRQATTLLTAWNCRAGATCVNQLSTGAGASLQQQDRHESQDASVQVATFASSARGQTLLAQHLMTPAAPQTQLGTTLRHLSTALRATQRPAGGLSLLSRPASLEQHTPLALQGLQQRRHLNAWSPAQRYFVEGDHVIQAEANRTIQFTGLDAGSFYPFVVYTAFAAAVSAVFVILPFIVAPTRVDLDKSSAYECGFDAFGEARQTFSVSFYLVSIMYLLFDIEIAYLFPYVMTHANTPMFWTMNLFLGILVAGFVYEWGVGALEWRESEAH